MAGEALAAHAVGVTHGDGTAVHVQTITGNAQLVAAVNHLHGKGFVEFPQINVADLEAQASQHLGDGEHGADAHFVRFAAGHGKAEKAAQRFQAFLFRQGFIHDDAGTSAVRKLAGVAC